MSSDARRPSAAARRISPPVRGEAGCADHSRRYGSLVRAPNLGTFYRAPKPGAAPYVAIGQKVEAETEVCLIEVMKLFTSVCAGVAGTVREVLVGRCANSSSSISRCF